MSVRWRSWLPWAVLIGIAIAALAVGTHRSSAPASLDARVTHIASEVRCPVCEGQSAAQSQSAASLQIRDQIRQELSAGESEGQILAGLVRAYGPSILEKPQATGVALIVWVLPVLALLAGVGGLVIAFRRWRSAMTPPSGGPSDEDRILVNDALANDALANDALANDALANDALANDVVANEAPANDGLRSGQVRS